MTIIIKLVLFPLTYRSYLSSAKMRVLKPEIDKLTKDIPEENQMERSQVTMNVYSKAGVSPMGGCLPMLLQMPILIAMFTFFPTAIELRGESFLWAEDLSAYDAIVTFPFSLPLIGDHISLFCLLMTITNVVYTKFNMQMTAGAGMGGDANMKMMKYMMYAMPLIFFFVFNDYASGLTYYYFISLLLTIVQTIAMRYTIDDKKLLAKIEEKKSTNTMSKGNWMNRLQEMQQQMLEQQKQKMEQQNNQKK